MDKDRLKAFTGKVFDDMAASMAVGMVYLGARTGLFRAMAGRGPMTAAEVVEASGLQARYVEEWLQGMVAARYLDYEPDGERYALPEEHAYLLASDGTDHYVCGLHHMAPVLLSMAPRVAEAFEHGGGVPFDDIGEHGIEALDLVNQGSYEHRFASYWIQALPETVARLEAGARALDMGCGVGRVSMSLAAAFPQSRFLGVDLDSHSIARARAECDERGLSERVKFEAARVEALEPDRLFDLVTVCDCVHDLTDPVGTLGAVRGLLAPGGTVLIVEPKAADRLEDNVNPIAAMFYGFSLFHCMTQSLAAGGPGLGTCMGPAKLEALARDAGFTRFDTLDIRSPVNGFFALGA
jgi:ubiquinone/menaquinone biosynthesis C-methylase UbiE